jgi:hypothetical protein
VRGLASDEAAQTHHRSKAPALGRFLGRERNFERAWHLDHAHVVVADAACFQSGKRPRLQPIGDEVVELRHDDGQLQSCALVRAFKLQHHDLSFGKEGGADRGEAKRRLIILHANTPLAPASAPIPSATMSSTSNVLPGTNR